MNILKEKNRLEYMDLLIRQCRTGNAHEFARKLRISRSTLMRYLEELRILGCPIIYCTNSKTYKYKKDGKLIFDFVIKKN